MVAFPNTARDEVHCTHITQQAIHPPILVTVTAIKQNLWSVESSDGSVGGTFVSRKAALAFAHEAMVSSNAAVVVNEDCILRSSFGRNAAQLQLVANNAPNPRSRNAESRPARAASWPLFSEREILIGFSIVAIGLALHVLG